MFNEPLNNSDIIKFHAKVNIANIIIMQFNPRPLKVFLTPHLDLRGVSDSHLTLERQIQLK